MKLFQLCILIAAAAFALSVKASGPASAQIAGADFPACSQIRISSPDQRWVLISDTLASNCPSQNQEKARSVTSDDSYVRLLLTDQRTQSSRSVDVDGWGGHAEWSSDSSAFLVNEYIASNEGEARLYRASNLRKLDLRKAILRKDRSVQRFMDGHSYIRARQWISDDTALVQLCGHRDEAPVVQFDIRYQVSLDGQVKRVSEQVGPPDAGGDCFWSQK